MNKEEKELKLKISHIMLKAEDNTRQWLSGKISQDEGKKKQYEVLNELYALVITGAGDGLQVSRLQRLLDDGYTVRTGGEQTTDRYIKLYFIGKAFGNVYEGQSLDEVISKAGKEKKGE